MKDLCVPLHNPKAYRSRPLPQRGDVPVKTTQTAKVPLRDRLPGYGEMKDAIDRYGLEHGDNPPAVLVGVRIWAEVMAAIDMRLLSREYLDKRLPPMLLDPQAPPESVRVIPSQEVALLEALWEDET